MMEQETFGSVLRSARERRGMSLTEVARRTKLSEASLEQLETGGLAGLPPEVFVRGFIRSYARFVGIADSEPLGLYQKACDEKRRCEALAVAQPKLPVERGEASEDDGQTPRRGIGLAVFVIIVLLIATITWSLFLRQTPTSGEGLSLLPAPTVPALADAAASAPGTAAPLSSRRLG